MTIEPDTKDWTWVLDERCPECGYDATAVDPSTIGQRVRQAVPRWQHTLRRDNVAVRPSDEVWSPLEYACHVRDVFTVDTIARYHLHDVVHHAYDVGLRDPA